MTNWNFNLDFEEYEKRFIEENRMEQLREECLALDFQQVYIESAFHIPNKPFDI